MSQWRYDQLGQDRWWHGWNQRSSGLWDRGCSRGYVATSDGWQDAMRECGASSSGNGVAAVAAGDTANENGVAAVAAGDTANENGVAAVAAEDTSLVQPCDTDLHQQVTAVPGRGVTFDLRVQQIPVSETTIGSPRPSPKRRPPAPPTYRGAPIELKLTVSWQSNTRTFVGSLQPQAAAEFVQTKAPPTQATCPITRPRARRHPSQIPPSLSGDSHMLSRCSL